MKLETLLQRHGKASSELVALSCTSPQFATYLAREHADLNRLLDEFDPKEMNTVLKDEHSLPMLDRLLDVANDDNVEYFLRLQCVEVVVLFLEDIQVGRWRGGRQF